MLSQSFFVHNRRQLRSLVIDEIVVITANSLVQRSGDTVHPFRQESNFFYLTGLKLPDLILVMCGDEEFIILPKRSHVEDIFGGYINCDEIAKMSGIKTILENKVGWARYKKLQQSRKKVYTLTAPSAKVTFTDAFYTNPARRALCNKLKRTSTTTLIDLRSMLVSLRQIKQPEEVRALEQAIELTGVGLQASKALIKEGINGHALKAELDYVFARAGQEHAFTPIVTSGLDTAYMHSLNYSKEIKTNEPILFDIGAEYELYSADVSRTYFYGQKTARYQSIYEAVLMVKLDVEKLVKPGITWREWALRVDELMGERLIKLGLIKRNERSEVRKYFSHAIGHSLGLDTHDMCDYQEIKKGMVITIEPGIYVPEENIGVRIEDDYLVTTSGLTNLSACIPLQ